jgi:predicted N-acyltransferase
VVDIEEQEFVIDHSWIDSSEELGVSEFMKLNGGQTLVRD